MDPLGHPPAGDVAPPSRPRPPAHDPHARHDDRRRSSPPEAEARQRPLWLVGLIAAMVLVPVGTLTVIMRLLPSGKPSLSLDLPSAPAEPSAAPPDDGVGVAGRVLDADGEPVSGAKVRVLRSGSAAVLREGASDHEGRFSFGDLTQGKVVVAADHDEKGAVVSAELTLSGAPVRDLVLTLSPGRQVSGTITDEDGQPVEGAQASIEGLPWLVRSARAGEGGAFSLAHVPPQASQLRASAPGYAPAVVRLRSSSDEQVSVKLRKEPDIEGQVLDAEGQPIRAAVLACGGKDPSHKTVSGGDGRFRFPREMASCPLMAIHDRHAPSDEVVPGPGGGQVTLRLRAGGGIAGAVVDEDGSPVARFSLGIESFTPSFGERDHSVRSGGAQAFDDPSGAFSLEKLAPGSYVLSAGVEGRSPVRSRSVDVSAGQVTSGVRIVVSRGGTVEGQVFDEERRAPIAGARVAFDATTSARGADGTRPVTTGEDGRFRLENAPSGPFSLRVDREGFGGRIVAGLRVEARQTLRQDVSLKPAGDGGAQVTFGGVGAVLGQTRDGIAFTAVFDGSPAEKAGVLVGDLLRKIDGESVEGLSVADAIQRLRGEPGSRVRVTVQRSSAGLVELTLARAEITR